MYVICQLCNNSIAKHSLSQHLKTHKKCPKQYHKEFINENDSEFCVKCGNKTKWVSVILGHKLFCLKCSKKNKPSCIDYWVYNYNYSLEEAKQKVKSHQINSSPRRVEYWLNLGRTHEEALAEVVNVQRRDKQWFIKNKGEGAWETYIERQRYTCTSEYLGEEKYKEIINNLTSYSSLDDYINAYGEEFGKLKWAKKYGYNTYEEYETHAATKKYPSLFYSKKFRTSILKRQYNKCGNPECHVIYNTGVDFHLHHINYVKSDMNDNNLIFLCNNCHSKTNYKRHEWQTVLSKINEEIISEYCDR